MTLPDHAHLRTVVRTALTGRAGVRADAAALAIAARRAYADLSSVVSPLVGQAGVDALAARAVHLARRDHSLGPKRESDQSGEPFNQVTVWMEQQDPARAIDGAAAVLATFAELLTAFIGDALTTRLLKEAWPDGFSQAGSQETHS